MSTKVEQWIACDLRYVAETKLKRLTDDELAKLYFGLSKKHGLSLNTVSADPNVMIEKLMQMKKEIQIAYAATAAAEKAQSAAEATKAVEQIFASSGGDGGGGGEEEAEAEAEAPVELTEEELAAKRDREARAEAFIQLAAAVAPPETPKSQGADTDVRPASPVTVETHHRLRVCSFNACKMRLGSANKAYTDASDAGDDDKDNYEGTHKGAELAQKWLTLAAVMADFDVILLQEVPGTEKVMNQKVETFAAMLEIATEEGQFWTAVSSQKSGKDGKVVGPGAEVHVCFIKSPLEFKSWNTLRKVGATELDYAPLQVELHDPRFADPADQSFVLTSVHLPPSKRVDARDSQIAALLRNYAAPDTSEYRMQKPFKPNKETKVAPTHMICGDFNTYPGQEQYNMLGNGFVSKIPKDAATTSGHQNFDNVLVDACANERFLIGGGILQLKDPHNAAKGEVGLSDHYPVFVEVCEVQKTKRAAGTAAATAVVHRQAYEEEPSVEEREALAPIAPPAIVQADAEAPPLPSVAEDGEEYAVAAREVVHAVMEEVKQSVIEQASKAEDAVKAEEAVTIPPPEAPPEAAPSMAAPPSPPSPAVAPARGASPTPAQTQEEANRELDRELAEVLGTGPESEPAASSEESFVIA